MAEQMTRRDVKTLGLASLGSVLEYYDFLVYAFLAAALSDAFFPADMPVWLREMQVFSIFALGYLIRPLAGIVMGHYSDRLGRKKLFMFTIILMAVSTFMIGILPTYQQAGWVAPVLLLLCRLLQGCAIGGEVPGASVFVSEHAPPARLALAGATLYGVINLAQFMGTGAGAASAAIAAHDPLFTSLAWRLPFLLGGVFGLIAIYLRRQLEETPLFLKILKAKRLSVETPLKVVLKNHLAACCFIIGVTYWMGQTVGAYFQFMPTYLATQYHLPRVMVLTANMWAALCYAVSMPIWGWYADVVGWGKAMATGAALGAMATLYFYASLPAIASGDASLTVAWIIVGIAVGCVGLVPALVSSLFPTEIRFSGFSFPYNIGVAAFVGPAPLVLTWLVQQFGPAAPMYAALVVFAIAFILALACGHMRFYLGRTTVPETYGSAVLAGK